MILDTSRAEMVMNVMKQAERVLKTATKATPSDFSIAKDSEVRALRSYMRDLLKDTEIAEHQGFPERLTNVQTER